MRLSDITSDVITSQYVVGERLVTAIEELRADGNQLLLPAGVLVNRPVPSDGRGYDTIQRGGCFYLDEGVFVPDTPVAKDNDSDQAKIEATPAATDPLIRQLREQVQLLRRRLYYLLNSSFYADGEGTYTVGEVTDDSAHLKIVRECREALRETRTPQNEERSPEELAAIEQRKARALKNKEFAAFLQDILFGGPCGQ